MTSRVLSVVVLVGLAATHDARAEGDATARTPVSIAVAVNAPLRWSNGDSLCASLYVSLLERHAIRLNVASYANVPSGLGEVFALAFGGDGDEASYSGRTRDLGVGWVYHLLGPWRGPTIELGLLRRARDIRVIDDDATPESVAVNTTMYGGRALFGWSWLLYRHFFVATALGFSIGHEIGTDTTVQTEGRMPVTVHVSRTATGGEAMLRIGAAFDL